MFDCDSSCLGWTSVSAFFFFLFHESKHLFFSLFVSFSCCSFHETEEDGAERLHSEARHKLLRLQAVSTI